MFQQKPERFTESVVLELEKVEGGIPMPEWIEDYPLFVAKTDGQLHYLNFDGDNGIHAFAGDGLKDPPETRMRFLAINIEQPRPILNAEDIYPGSAFESVMDGIDYLDMFEGFEELFWEAALSLAWGERKEVKGEIVFEVMRDFLGDVDVYPVDITT